MMMNADATQKLCSICLETFSTPSLGSLQPCTHSFCLECLATWLSKEIKCPICKKDATGVVKHPETLVLLADFVKKQAPTPKKEHQSVSLECMDHTYMLVEITKLTTRLRHAKDRSSTYANRSNDYNGKAQKALKNIEKTLKEFNYLMESFGDFEASTVMTTLYDIDADLTRIINGGSLDKLMFADEFGYLGAGAENYYYEEGCDDDYYYDDYEDEIDPKYVIPIVLQPKGPKAKTGASDKPAHCGKEPKESKEAKEAREKEAKDQLEGELAAKATAKEKAKAKKKKNMMKIY